MITFSFGFKEIKLTTKCQFPGIEDWSGDGGL